jgi:hypothetical protein
MNPALEAYMAWAKKNSFTMVGIIIILLVVGWYYNNIEPRILETARQCNAHWEAQVKLACPAAFDKGYVYGGEMTLPNVTLEFP